MAWIHKQTAEEDIYLTRAMKQFQFNLPEGSIVIGDKAYNDYDFEDLLSDAVGIDLRPLRRKNSTREEPAYVEAYVEYVQRVVDER